MPSEARRGSPTRDSRPSNGGAPRRADRVRGAGSAPAGLFLGLLALLGAGCASQPEAPSADVVAMMSGQEDEGYARVTEPRALRFPEDHGPHPAYRTEWWYYTGNLDAVEEAGGASRRYGFQLTFFRNGLAPESDERESAWGTDQSYLAHFALMDEDAGRYRSAERLARGAVGLAGARADPYEVWLESWSAEEQPDGRVRLQAADGPMAIDLYLEPLKPPALHGQEGFSPKGPEPGNASFYYSLSRQAATGTVTSGGETIPVQGLAWMDHEWSTSALSEGMRGWDWLSLQLDDGRELMLFQIRDAEGAPSAESSGSLVDGDAGVTHLAREDFALEPRGTWTSPRSGGTYPSGWRVAVPGQGLELLVEPILDDQEFDGFFRYWEGAVEVEGEADGAPVSGRGYVELTGYASSGPLPGQTEP